MMHKKSVLGFLKNGSDYFPFGDQNKLPENSLSSQGSFVPFQQERNQVGRLVTETPSIMKRKSRKLQKITSADAIGLQSYLPKLKTESEQQKGQVFDPVTKYVTLLTTGSLNDEGIVDLKQYTLNHNQVERGQLLKKPARGIDHKFQLISKRTKNLTTQTPAIGIYNPSPLPSHLPNIQIKSKVADKESEQWNHSFKTPEDQLKQDKKSVHTPKENLNKYEMIFAKEISQINREVESEMKRNPNQHFFTSQYDMIGSMDLEEAEGMRNRMKAHFQSVKDSLNKIKNLINIKR